MAKSDARFGYEAKLNRELQDLQVDPIGFTTAAGMLNPIFADFASPGDKYYITHTLDFLRTNPLVAPAMCDVKVHYESYFVPIQMLYQPFEQSFFSLVDLQSSFYTPANLLNNTLPVFNYSNYVTAVNNEPITSNAKPDAFRFADLLGLNAFNFVGSSIVQSNGYKPSFFPWQALAYHCIFQYVYRLDDKSQFDNSKFNWDKYYATSTGVTYTGSSGFFGIYQRPWDFDYYTSLYRSPIVSNANLQQVLPNNVYQPLVTESTQGINNVGNNTLVNSEVKAFSSGIGSTFSQQDFKSSYNSALIRQMFANERLAMITGRTRKTYDSQVLAHFGINVPHDPKHDIARIGHDVYDLQIGEVTSLADTSNAALGDLAGKGWSSSYRNGNNIANKHEFVAPCHGVVMTIFSIEPKRRYYGGFHKQNAVSNIFDFPVPEFDRLGNQPIFRFEIGNRNSDSLLGTVTQMTDQVGWNMRYQQWKKRASRTTLAFMSGNAYGGTNVWNSYMITTLPFAIADVSNPSNYDNVSRPDLEGRFYIDRHCTDPLMVVPFADGWKQSETGEDWNSSPWMVYARDPFIVDSHEVVKKASWMSKDGEPVYNW